MILVFGVVGWVIVLIAFVVLSAAVRSASVKNTRSGSPRVIPFRREERRVSLQSRSMGQDKPSGRHVENETRDKQFGTA